MTLGAALKTLPLLLLTGIMAAGAALAATGPARADLRVCNQTSNEVSIAMGYRAEQGWQSEGWWLADSNQCATVYQGDLNARFYYLFVADDIGGGAWDGSVFMCTRDETFTIFGVEDCLARGYERTGFFEVDTQNRSDWTLELTEGQGTASPQGADGDAAPLDNVPSAGDTDAGDAPVIEDEPMGDEGT